MEPLLASHFQHSYFVDVRHFEKDVGYKFDLDSFISQNNITDVIFLGRGDTILKVPMSNQKVEEGAN